MLPGLLRSGGILPLSGSRDKLRPPGFSIVDGSVVRGGLVGIRHHLQKQIGNSLSHRRGKVCPSRGCIIAPPLSAFLLPTFSVNSRRATPPGARALEGARGDAFRRELPPAPQRRQIRQVLGVNRGNASAAARFLPRRTPAGPGASAGRGGSPPTSGRFRAQTSIRVLPTGECRIVRPFAFEVFHEATGAEVQAAGKSFFQALHTQAGVNEAHSLKRCGARSGQTGPPEVRLVPRNQGRLHALAICCRA